MSLGSRQPTFGPVTPTNAVWFMEAMDVDATHAWWLQRTDAPGAAERVAISFDDDVTRLAPVSPLAPNAAYDVALVWEPTAGDAMGRAWTPRSATTCACCASIAATGRRSRASTRSWPTTDSGALTLQDFAIDGEVRGAQEYGVIAVDDAGNESEAATLRVDVGCASAPPAPAAALLVALLAWRRRCMR